MQHYQPSPAPASKSNGLATAAMVLGIASFIFWICCIPAVILGIISLNQIKHAPQMEGKGMAVAGLVCGSIVMVLGILFIIYLIAAIATTSTTDTSDFWTAAIRYAASV